MAFGNISALYLPVAANAGTSQWGTDVRLLLDTPNAGVDASTRMNHGTTTTPVNRTCDPYTNPSAVDADESLFGWAVQPSDMGSVTGALRFYPAGNHTATFVMAHNATTSAGGTLAMYVYRVGPGPGRTRTLLGSNTATVNLPINSGEVTATCTVALGEVIFAADETIQYSFEFSVAGVGVTGRISRMHTGTQSGVASRVDTPRLGVLAEATGTAAGLADIAGASSAVLATTGTTTGTGAAAGTLAATATTTGTAPAAATTSGQASAVAGTTGTAAGTAEATGHPSRVLGTTGTVEIGPGETPPETVIRPVFIFDD